MKFIQNNRKVAYVLIVTIMMLLLVFIVRDSEPEEVVEVTETTDIAVTTESTEDSSNEFQAPVESGEDLSERVDLSDVEVDKVQEEVVALETGTPQTPSDPTPPKTDVETIEASSQSHQLTGVHKSTLLTQQNSVRSAKGLPTLSWSESVAESAQAWADELGARGCAMEHSDTVYGENIYYSWSTGNLTLNPSAAVGWWAAEESNYDYDTNTCATGKVCSHYTQIVWKETTTLGCGLAVCTDDSRQTQLWVCQYSPAGNDDTRPY